MAEPLSHVNQRAVVIPDLKVFYTPVPKASCTGILWMLAELAGLEEERFLESSGPEVSPPLTIHDPTRWDGQFLLSEREDAAEILTSDDWFRFTVVRDPYPRLFSAWQSKLLLAEPQFISKYSGEPWFPMGEIEAADIPAAFREFVAALEKDAELLQGDVHWRPQVELTSCEEIAYTHIGRVESLDETFDRLREHVASLREAPLPDERRENVAPLPYEDGIYGQEFADTVARLYAADFDSFGYKRREDVPESPRAEWFDQVEVVTPAVRELRGRNERMQHLQHRLRDTRRQWHTQRTRRVRLEQRVGGLERDLGELRTSLEQERKRLALVNKDRSAQRTLINESAQTIAALERDLGVWKRRARKAKRRLERIEGSRAWRWSAPLRRLEDLLRRAT